MLIRLLCPRYANNNRSGRTSILACAIAGSIEGVESSRIRCTSDLQPTAEERTFGGLGDAGYRPGAPWLALAALVPLGFIIYRRNLP